MEKRRESSGRTREGEWRLKRAPKGRDKEDQRCYLERRVRALSAKNDTYEECCKALFFGAERASLARTDAEEALTALLPLHIHCSTLLCQLSAINITLSKQELKKQKWKKVKKKKIPLNKS